MMFDFIHKLHQVLNMIKGFEVGYSSSNMNSLLVKQDEKVFKVEITYVGEGEIGDHFHKLSKRSF